MSFACFGSRHGLNIKSRHHYWVCLEIEYPKLDGLELIFIFFNFDGHSTCLLLIGWISIYVPGSRFSSPSPPTPQCYGTCPPSIPNKNILFACCLQHFRATASHLLAICTQPSTYTLFVRAIYVPQNTSVPPMYVLPACCLHITYLHQSMSWFSTIRPIAYLFQLLVCNSMQFYYFCYITRIACLFATFIPLIAYLYTNYLRPTHLRLTNCPIYCRYTTDILPIQDGYK